MLRVEFRIKTKRLIVALNVEMPNKRSARYATVLGILESKHRPAVELGSRSGNSVKSVVSNDSIRPKVDFEHLSKSESSPKQDV